MQRFLLGLALSLLPLSANADDPPRLYDAGAEEVPIYASPSSEGEVLGHYPADAAGIEILRYSDGWGLIGFGESHAWVHAEPLEPVLSSWKEASFMWRCHGIETEWGLVKNQRDDDTFSSPETGEITVKLSKPDNMILFNSERQVFTATAPGLTLRAVRLPAACQKYGTKRQYGYAIDAFLSRDGAEDMILTGCCTAERTAPIPKP